MEWKLGHRREQMLKKHQAFEMWRFRRVLDMSWVDQVTCVDVLRRIGKKPELMNNIKSRKPQYFGRTLRGEKYQIVHLIMQGKILREEEQGKTYN